MNQSCTAVLRLLVRGGLDVAETNYVALGLLYVGGGVRTGKRCCPGRG